MPLEEPNGDVSWMELSRKTGAGGRYLGVVSIEGMRRRTQDEYVTLGQHQSM